ncbi:hypothetical protein V5O48_014015 [Marasmius crinis-equi]|uniref:Uncharacterized protein n=1 Tax=Marasmius crinis-equi TaxID=585013 RepID=A0ABR3EYI5_9AGAR
MPAARSPEKKAYQPRSRMASPQKNAYRWKTCYEPRNKTCKGDGGTCPNPVSVRPCQGTANPKHRGLYYEACEASLPWLSHFNDWREDLTPTGLPTLTVHRFRPGSDSLSDLLHGDNIEEEEFTVYPRSPSKYTTSPTKTTTHQTPIQTPAVEDLFLLDHPATPTSNRVMTPLPLPQRDLTEAEALEYSRYIDASEEHLFSPSSDTIPPLPPTLFSALDSSSSSYQPVGIESDSHFSLPKSKSYPPNGTEQSFVPPATLSSADNTSVKSTWIVSQRTERFINGKMKAICPGKLCAAKTDHDFSGRPAQQCTFLFCKACCLAYQREERIPCKCPSHKPDTSRTAAPSAAQLTRTSTEDEPHISQPLNPIHYAKHERAVEHYHHRAQTVTSQKMYEEEHSKAVDITFWNEQGVIEEFTVTMATFPLFKLSDSLKFVQDAIGSSPEIYQAETGRWRRAEITVPRPVVAGETVLYRSAQKYGQTYEFPVPDEMTALMEAQTRLRSPPNPRADAKAVKRKATDTGDGRPAVRPRIDHPLPATNVDRTEVLSDDSPSSSPRQSPEPQFYQHFQWASTSIPEQTLPPITVGLKKELTAAQMTECLSGHAPWPLKYFKPMKEGIERASEMSVRSELQRHRLAFPMSTAQDSTLACWMKYWHAASDELKKQFAAQHDSTWQGFCNAVAEKYPGKKVPGLKEQRQTRKGGKAKSEVEDTPVKREETDVIIIDD